MQQAKVIICLKRRYWFGWERIEALDYQWLAGRTCAAGLGYSEDENGGKVTTKLADVAFPLQIAITQTDGSILYIPNVAARRMVIKEL